MFNFQMLLDEGFQVLCREDMDNMCVIYRFTKDLWSVERRITYLELQMFKGGFKAHELIIANAVREEFLRSPEGKQVVYGV